MDEKACRRWLDDHDTYHKHPMYRLLTRNGHPLPEDLERMIKTTWVLDRCHYLDVARAERLWCKQQDALWTMQRFPF